MLSEKELKEKANRGRSRLVVLLFFLGTTLLAGVFYLSSWLPQFWQKLTAPAVIKPTDGIAFPTPTPTLRPTPTPKFTSLEEELENLLDKSPVEASLFFYDQTSEESFAVGGAKQYPAASLIKLPVIFTLYQKAEKGEVDLTQQYSLKEEDKIADDFGSVNSQPLGTTYTYRGLAELALNQSDNVASRILEAILGEEEIQRTIDFLGMEQTDFLDRSTTAADMALLFEKILDKEILNQTHREEIIEYLTRTAFEEQIPAQLPEKVIVAHKVGITEDVLHDGGIIFSPQPWVLIILTRGEERGARQQLIKEVASTAWQAVSR